MQQFEQNMLGHYQLQRRLAQGGMAEIYLALDLETNQMVAVKLVHTSAGDYCERFRREVKVLATLSHKHILPVLDYGEYESWCYLITPYIEYGTLNDRIKQGALPLSEADHVLDQLTQALQYAHDQGIIHRDIKPSNVLMRDGTHVYLADFGLVKQVGKESGLTLSGYLIGTPEYMAPELAETDATQRSDVYALGILLYQMLTGQLPFKASTPIGIYLRHINDTPEMPSKLNPAIPTVIEDVIIHAMEKDPDRRYQTPHEFYQAYKHALHLAESAAEAPTEIEAIPLSLTLQRPRVTIVQQKHRMLRGHMLLMTMILPFLLFIAPLIFAVVVFPNLWKSNNIDTLPPISRLQQTIPPEITVTASSHKQASTHRAPFMLVKHDSSATGISGLFLSTHSGDRHTHHHTHSHR
jgi:serine/threonine protein kinase